MAMASLGTSRAPVERPWLVRLAGASLGSALLCLALMAGNLAADLPIETDARLGIVVLAALSLTGWCLSMRRLHALRDGLAVPGAEAPAGTLGWPLRQAEPSSRRAFLGGLCLGLQGASLVLIVADVLLGVAMQGGLRVPVALTLIGATGIGQLLRVTEARRRQAAQAGGPAGRRQDGNDR